MYMVGKKAPSISCKAIIKGQIKDFSLSDYKGRMKVLFFYPLDFSFVCPTELHAFQESIAEFDKRETSILGISVDSVYSHLAWLAQPKSDGGIAGIEFPLLSDITKTIAREYGVLDETEGIAFRAVFIIDEDDVIQCVQCNNLSLGRNISEVLRMIDAIRFVATHGEACPANWSLEQAGIETTHSGVIDYFHKHKQ